MQTNILTTLAALSLIACASSQAQEPQAAPPAQSTAHHGAHGGHMQGSSGMKQGGMMQHDSCPMAENCPMKLPGVVVRAQDVAGGATLTFTTSGDVAALRERVRKMAQMHTEGCHANAPAASPSPSPSAAPGKPAPKATTPKATPTPKATAEAPPKAPAP